ncbi:hypothetical protein [Uliginosibacterium gangwonense]|uniref:hypothetical protein n=1 Tax=Uliginosibacterium gangwonense TaxID=392736 RepID=UPI00035EC35B|nr:hypothetical protein [Uliginosibacterium gangwonense]
MVIRTILHPVPFLFIGVSELFKPVSKWAFICFVALALCSIVMSGQDVPKEAKSFIFSSSIIIPMILVIFAPPSTFVFDSIKDNQISSLSEFIESLGFSSEDELKHLEDNISDISERAFARIKSLQWIIATAWAVYLYAVNQIINITLKFAPEQFQKMLSENFLSSIFLFTLFLFSILVIVSYKKGHDAVFRRVHFAIQELKFQFSLNNGVEA